MKTIGEKIKGTQFEQDLTKTIRMNDGFMAVGVYNLILSIRDMKLFCKIGMKPHRRWRMKDVKWYFGVNGGKDKVLAQLEEFMVALKTAE
tara:strand:- start:136 stop:405 length:270 start_codon:yes stop_codon:yes gene_type:complete